MFNNVNQLIYMTFRELLKKYNIRQLDIAYKLGIPQSNLKRYDNLKERSVNEVILIHELTKIPYKELIETELKDD